ncbi:MAG: hypothetical protein JXQ29_13395 [Planctomycetes bacterium]|nr:hypothetical protein [Planctomycetota bacterium]
MPLGRLELDLFGLEMDLVLEGGAAAGPEGLTVLEDLERDFRHFKRVPRAGPEELRPPSRVELEIRAEDVDRTALPVLRSVGLTPRNYFFADGRTLYADYFGKAFTIFRQDEQRLELYTTRPALAYEIAYLFVLSQFGLHLDRVGLRRVHGLGLSYRGHGILLLLPSGGGKSTHGFKLLQNPHVRILSEDSPVLDRKLRMHAFPTRIGIDPAEIGEKVAPEHVRTIDRMEFAPKTVIDIACFEDRIETGAVRLERIFIGRRFLGNHAAIRRAGRLRGFKALLTKLVIGIGLYQGLEYLMHRGIRSALKLAPAFAGRLVLALKLCARTRLHFFEMGGNVERNVQTLVAFLEAEYGGDA